MFCFHAYGITYNNTKNSQANVFADNNFLMRCMISIIGLSSILKNYYDVGLDRIGTHVLDNFFGQVRYSCRDYDSWEHLMLSISNGTIRKRILCKYCINIPIVHRINVGGIHLFQENESSFEFENCLDNLSKGISKVLL